MLIVDKGHFIKGSLLFVSFLIVLVLMFMPFFSGKNTLEAADDLFNSISKGSTNYIPDIIKKNEAYKKVPFTATVKLRTESMAPTAAKLLTAAAAKTAVTGAEVKVDGSLGEVLAACLKDAGDMFNNKQEALKTRYQMQDSGKDILLVWWYTLKDLHRDLTRQNLFKEAKHIDLVIKKGVEPGYNYFGVEPQTASSRAGILTFSLIFYVVYTLWWGVAILFLFEGFGLALKAGKKKEV